MKILFAVDSLCGGGAERVISTLANYIQSNCNCQVGIVLLFANTIEYRISDDIPIYGVDSKILPHDFSKRGEKAVSIPFTDGERRIKTLDRIKTEISEFRDVHRRAKLLAELVNKQKYDAVISFLTNSNEVVCKAKKLMSAKVVISERSDPNSTVFKSRFNRKLINTYNLSDRIVFQTEYAMNSYPKKLRKKGVIIPNPVQDGLPEPYEGERKKRIVAFSRLTRQKNLPLLIDSFSEVLKTHPEYELDIYGKGDIKPELEHLIETKNLSEKVHLYDFRDNIHEIVKDYAMFVSSSDYEGISNSMIEALAVGLPCICTDCPAGGARMAIKNGENGLLVPVNDKGALTEAMIRVIEDPETARRLSENAVSIRGKWSVGKIAEKWMSAITN